MRRAVLFDAVLFDLDGTLVATDRFWIQAARTGTRRVFEELGLDQELPSSEEWMQIVGLPPEVGYRALFSHLSPAERRRVRHACEEEEERLILAGEGALMPGAEVTLRELRASGIRLGIASNCSRAYLERVTQELGLHELVEAAFCIESDGKNDKADMVAALLERFGTRSALMVGDRIGDRDAAWENGVPHIHCDFGFAPPGEIVEAEAKIQDLGQLPGLLERRSEWIEQALDRCAAFDAEPPFILGITGGPGSGKSLFARDAARCLRAAGLPAAALGIEPFGRASTGPACFASAAETWYDLEPLEQGILERYRRGEGVEIPPLARLEERDAVLESEMILVLEGLYLLDPRLQSRLDRVIHLEVPEEIRRRRLAGRASRAGRDARAASPEAWARRRAALDLLEEHRARYAPERLADLVLDAGNPLGPRNHAAP